MRRLVRTVAALATVTLAALSAGCGGSTPAKKSTARTPDKIAYLTAFGAVGRDAFIWVAKEKGFLRAAGLDVDIQLGAATDTNLKALSAGTVQFGSNDLMGAVIGVGKGQYQGIRAIGAVHQRNLSSVVVLEGSSIKSPRDLVGKKLGVANGSVVKQLYPAYAKLAGIDPKVTWVGVAAPSLPALLASKQVDALATFLIGTTAVEKAAGRKTLTLPFSQYLPDLYGNALFTTADYAAAHKDIVTRFRAAALKGLQYTIDHPEEAGQILHRYNPTADAAAATGEIKLMTPAVRGDTGTVGVLDKDRLSRAIDLLSTGGLFPAGLTPDKVVDFSFASARG